MVFKRYNREVLYDKKPSNNARKQLLMFLKVAVSLVMQNINRLILG